jgi:hypothetical protein
MNDNSNTPSRRRFLSLSLLAGAGLVAGKADAQPVTETGDKIKMLTPDGKLVEVDKGALVKATKKPASKKDVLRWIHPEKK